MAHSSVPEEAADRGVLLERLAVDVDPQLLELALTHRSYAYEHGGLPHNERLEFLGDAILGKAVTVKLYRDNPKLDEGDLAKRRASLVSSIALAEIARSLNLGAFLRLGRGEERTGGRDKSSILADAVEAVIGAVYLSTDDDVATQFVLRLVQPLADDPERFGGALDPKTSLQEVAARRGAGLPVYSITATGPDHSRSFTATVTVGDLVTATGIGSSKKQAEMAAALDAFNSLVRKRRKGDPAESTDTAPTPV
ncbi:ribonuclease 3 [Naasia aerilata]|uniref:Ribonuclease 3 n=1 Tax=Naasia aerilata TaxID=1162966 RepID=A0ABN6XMW6_9MICO|nr:ribonuclease 3 [Naasia aerilata]